MKYFIVITSTLLCTSLALAHEGHSHAPTPETKKRIEQLNTAPNVTFVATQLSASHQDSKQPEAAKYFAPFMGNDGDGKSSTNNVKVRWDEDYLYVESNGMPDHPMMIGITAWQQQVPLPQRYIGTNAWRIPLHPVPAQHPMSAKEHFFRGAIALAVNGIPIFNPIKNDGKTDTLLAGELDQWGGHCGRADDYHYHLAPVHLEKIVGKGNPVGIALDGYPIYGYEDADGSKPSLDWLNGHKDAAGNYHYHATKTYPYLNGGFYGEVVERDGQVDPQPRAQGVRPALPGLRGAKITGFETPKPGSYVVKYDVFGEKRSVEYTVADNGSATFNFVSPQGAKTENYTLRQGGGSGRGNAQRPGSQRPGSQRLQSPPPGDRKSQNERGQGEADGGQPLRGGGDRIANALDANHDGQIDKTELSRAVEAFRKLDVNRDGQISAQELRDSGDDRSRDQGDQPRGNRPPGQAGGPYGPQPGDGPRQPWILVHADEIDLNKDKIISRDEIVGEAAKAFAGYDANHDGKLTDEELNGRGGSRSAMGGFLKGHFKEIDRDGDGILSRDEAIGNAERMFAKMDSNEDGNISPEELEASRRK
ncbi:MAG: YHYH protein [Planctomycetaceae bacterium]|nr:YHYH protein [Planctomycetales bacterium]MCB9924978.1 YHYH protein [Planctomycetaceae bacterium]